MIDEATKIYDVWLKASETGGSPVWCWQVKRDGQVIAFGEAITEGIARHAAEAASKAYGRSPASLS